MARVMGKSSSFPLSLSEIGLTSENGVGAGRTAALIPLVTVGRN
jgi:hypothetical protein